MCLLVRDCETVDAVRKSNPQKNDPCSPTSPQRVVGSNSIWGSDFFCVLLWFIPYISLYFLYDNFSLLIRTRWDKKIIYIYFLDSVSYTDCMLSWRGLKTWGLTSFVFFGPAHHIFSLSDPLLYSAIHSIEAVASLLDRTATSQNERLSKTVAHLIKYK